VGAIKQKKFDGWLIDEVGDSKFRVKKNQIVHKKLWKGSTYPIKKKE
jgi:hypothetical protein